MKEEVINTLNAVIGALGEVYVKGKANCANMSGSIAMLEQIAAKLARADFAEPKDEA